MRKLLLLSIALFFVGCGDGGYIAEGTYAKCMWKGEMYEIANTFSEAGITPKFHQGSADIMSLANKTPIANETRETVDQSRSLKQALDLSLIHI